LQHRRAEDSEIIEDTGRAEREGRLQLSPGSVTEGGSGGTLKPLILLILLSSQTSTNTIATTALSAFLDQNGNTGIVSVERSPQATQVFYSFCIVTTAASCLQGQGNIPDSAFTGNLTKNCCKSEQLKLLVDTSTVPGFNNSICAPGCTPATGGLLDLTFTKTPRVTIISTGTNKRLENGKFVSTTTDVIYEFTSSMTGTVLGVTANTTGIEGSMGFETLDSTVKPHAFVVTKVMERWLKTQPWGKLVLRKLEGDD
jgi:hypothetical protein